jgi:SAM-dependent methyltransferase
VLDLGCGLGRHLLLLAAEGFDVTGVDVSPTAIETCRRRLREAGLSAAVLERPMTALDLPHVSFDAALAWNVLYHATGAEIVETIEAVRHALRPDGLLLTTFISTADGQLQRTRDLMEEGNAAELDLGTFVIPGDTVTDKALPHHYSTEPEVRDRFLPGFDVISLEEDRREELDFQGRPYLSAHWRALARRTP